MVSSSSHPSFSSAPLRSPTVQRDSRRKHEFEVAMTCEGCSGAVTRVLNKLGDEVKFEIDLPKKLVWIESEKDVDYLTEKLKKCGKEVKYNGTK
ncbi:Copper transport protein ATOX1 [Merluccius polli]|uniref:Copper transport protein ATOX1 n=1 Tax=Merluccius polli TaxID=89951 RepID=A0AA47MXS7_MERPO|nr:Copper transport protein ATOX1 [Merluccius polli]